MCSSKWLITPLLFVLLLAVPIPAQVTQRVSISTTGVPGDDDSSNASMSADGRYVAFQSSATNLIANDTNGFYDVFVHDRQSGTTDRVSVGAAGAEGNLVSYFPAISADGRYVAFYSQASNLVPGDTWGAADTFVHDRQSGTTERVSVDSNELEQHGGSSSNFPPAISADGRYVAFVSSAGNLIASDTNGMNDVFIRDRIAGTTERVSVSTGGAQADNHCSSPPISADGNLVAFYTNASSLEAGDTNNRDDVFVHDRQAGTTERVSVDSTGAQGDGGSTLASLSADGRY